MSGKFTPWSTVSFVTAYEAGDLTEDEIIDGFQAMVNSGVAWALQGHYGRTAEALLEAGLIVLPTPREVTPRCPLHPDEGATTCFSCHLAKPCDECAARAVYNGSSRATGARGAYCRGHVDFDLPLRSRDD